MSDLEPKKRRPRFRWAAFFIVVLVLISVGYQALFHPKTPLPDAWNPLAKLAVTDPVTPLTTWKMQRALADPALCLAALAEASQMTSLDPLEVSDDCHVRNRVRLAAVLGARIDPIETSCAIALRMALWEHHGIQPAAREILGAEVSVIRQVGSYNCRPIRTMAGNSPRWSTHTTADAIDITGFDLVDGRQIRLINDWDGALDDATFLRVVQESACKWFATTLGPNYNSLHADHFHLQSRGWGTCR